MTSNALEAPPEVPSEAWAFAWACLAGQVVSLVTNGRHDSNNLVLSMLLGVVVVGWVSHGVLTARGIRVGLVWVLFVLAGLFQLVTLFDDPSGGVALDLAITVIQLVLFIRFTATDYFKWQRTRPREPGPSLSGVMVIALLVGALGGVIGAQHDGVRTEVNF